MDVAAGSSRDLTVRCTPTSNGGKASSSLQERLDKLYPPVPALPDQPPLPEAPQPFRPTQNPVPQSTGVFLQYLARWQRLFRGDSFTFDYHFFYSHAILEPTGLALAVTLGLRGIGCVLVETRPGAHRIPKGQYLIHRSAEHFYFWGIVDKLRAALKRRAFEHKLTPTVGRSHGIHAEPTTSGLKRAGFYAEWRRNRERLQAARREIATCAISGAVGTYAATDPDLLARQLTVVFDGSAARVVVHDNALDGLSVTTATALLDAAGVAGT